MLRVSRCVLLVTLAVFPASSANALDRTWIGGNVDWIDNGSSANWSPADEPDPDDTAIFNTANTVNLGTGNSVLALTLSGGIDLLTNGQDLAVDGLVQLSGASTNLFVGGAASELNADNVTVNSGGMLELTGGTLVIDEESGTGLLDLNVGGTFAGHGTLTFADIPFAATTLLRNDGTLTAMSRGLTIFSPPPVGTLTINDSSTGGRIDLDGAGTAGVVNVNRNQTLDINVPLSDNFAGTMNLFQNATFDLSTAWTLDGGTINVNNGFVAASPPFPSVPADVSSIAGGALTQTGGTINVVDSDSTLQFDAPFTMNGGSLTNHGLVAFNSTATIGAGANFTMPTTSSSLTVEAGRHLTINQPNFDLDGGNALTNVITVNMDGVLEFETTDYDPDQVTNAFNGTINLDGGLNGLAVMSVVTSSATFVMDGTLNMSNGVSGSTAWLGEPLDIGNDSGAGDAQLHVTGSGTPSLLGTSSFNTSVDFNSDAVLTVAAGNRLIFTANSTVTFDTVNGPNEASISGSGELNFSGPVNVREAVTLNMVGGNVLLDGSDAGGDLISVQAPLTINTATMDGFGQSNNVGGPNTLDVNNNLGTGVLTVNLDSPTAAWTLNAQGVMNLVNDNVPATLLAGSDVNLNGTVNVTGDVRTTARVNIGSTGVINLNSVGVPFRLAGGDSSTAGMNAIAGGTINGPGLLSSESNHDLKGFGTINANIDFDGTSSLFAQSGTLTLTGQLLDGHSVGANNTGILNVVNSWNTNVVSFVNMFGGELRGGTITNDLADGITGKGLVTSRVINNRILRSSGGTLIFQTAGNDNDWDGVGNNGELRSVSGTLELRDTGTFSFLGGVIAQSNSTVFANGFSLEFDPGSLLSISGTYRSNEAVRLNGDLSTGLGLTSTLQVDAGKLLEFGSTSRSSLNGSLQLVSTNAIIRSGAAIDGIGRLNITVGSVLSADNGSNINARLENNGDFIVAPGIVGIVNVRNYQQFAASEMFVALSGPASSDRLVVTGTAQLAGGIDVKLQGGFVPNAGDTFTILTAPSGVSGGFSSVNQPLGMPANRFLDVLYQPTLVQLTAIDIQGDFDIDHQFDCSDVDLLVANIASGTNSLAFDLTGDTLVNQSDLDQWLANAGVVLLASNHAILPGDANLDGVVDGSDFGIWNAHKFTSIAAWCSGDFNADGVVDGSDFGIWNSRKFTSSDGLATVPEPGFGAAALLGLALTGMARLRRGQT